MSNIRLNDNAGLYPGLIRTGDSVPSSLTKHVTKHVINVFSNLIIDQLLRVFFVYNESRFASSSDAAS